jgi:hypothetical protein
MRSATRCGISLLEVLISMFVMLVGLLGVASLLPVGRFEVQRGAKIDRSSACGRVAFRDMKVRGVLNPNSWAAEPNGNAVYNSGAQTFDFNGDGTTEPFQAFAIDPLGEGSGAANGSRSFPYDPAGSLITPPPRIPRITLGPGLSVIARAALADMVFRSQDELAFDPGNSTDLIPAQVLQKDTSANSLKRLSEGNYSWLATVVPDPNLTTSTNFSEIPCRVSVAVFYKRNLNTAGTGERICGFNAVGGPGVSIEDEMRFQINAAAVDPQYSGSGEGAAHLNIKPGQWVLLATYKSAAPTVWYYAWHRIAAADDIVHSTNATYGDADDKVVSVTSPGTGGTWFRNVTLIGPMSGPSITIEVANTTAFLFDDIIAIYERDMTLETDSMY